MSLLFSSITEFSKCIVLRHQLHVLLKLNRSFLFSLSWSASMPPLSGFYTVIKKYRHGTCQGCMHAKSLRSCLTLWDSMDHSPPGSSVHGILQARILEWVVMPSSRGSSRCGKVGPLPLAPPGKPSSMNLNQKYARVRRDPRVNLSGEEIPRAHAK